MILPGGPGITASLFKGLDYEEAVLLAVLLVALLPSHRFFYRKTLLLNQQFTPAWIAAIAMVAISVLWLGLFSYKHVEYSDRLWWQFAFDGHAPRFLRASRRRRGGTPGGCRCPAHATRRSPAVDSHHRGHGHGDPM